MMLKAASLVYAIFISLVIGILCYSVVLMFSLNLNLENYFSNRQHLLENNMSAVEYLKENYKNINTGHDITLFPNESDVKTIFEESSWGQFKKFKIISIAQKDTISQNLLFGEKHINPAPAIYLRDNDSEFKIAGKTEIKGDIYISAYGLKKTTISGNSGFYEPTFEGKIFNSEKTLPKLGKNKFIYPENFELLLLSDIRQNTLLNSFDKITKVIEVENKLEDIKLKGNIIVRSKDTIYVMPSAKVEDIIIVAPKVVFSAGAECSVQVFSTHEIILDRDVKLRYPSVLVVESQEQPTVEKRIIVGESSTVEGAILLFGNGIVDENKNTIVLEKESLITGDVYCDGKLSFYGTVNGSVTTSSFLHKTENTEYNNLIFNGKILFDDLPKNFFQISCIENFQSEEPIIIKKL